MVVAKIQQREHYLLESVRNERAAEIRRTAKDRNWDANVTIYDYMESQGGHSVQLYCVVFNAKPSSESVHQGAAGTSSPS